MSDLPTVSCICKTYGRTLLLAETVESFRRQTYAGFAELLILNDHPGQTLDVDTRGFSPARFVRVINCRARFTTLGSKAQFALSQVSGEFLQVWDDDDICLPRHIQRGVETLLEDSIGATLTGTKPPPAARGFLEWCIWQGALYRTLFSPLRTVTMRTADARTLGFRSCERHHDVDFIHRAVASGWFRGAQHSQSRYAPTVIYRPDVAANHCSTALSTEDFRAEPGEPLGCVAVVPGWREDYEALTRNFSGQTSRVHPYAGVMAKRRAAAGVARDLDLPEAQPIAPELEGGA